MKDIWSTGEASAMLDACKRAKDHNGAVFFTTILNSLAKGSPYKTGTRLKASGGQYHAIHASRP